MKNFNKVIKFVLLCPFYLSSSKCCINASCCSSSDKRHLYDQFNDGWLRNGYSNRVIIGRNLIAVSCLIVRYRDCFFSLYGFDLIYSK